MPANEASEFDASTMPPVSADDPPSTGEPASSALEESAWASAVTAPSFCDAVGDASSAGASAFALPAPSAAALASGPPEPPGEIEPDDPPEDVPDDAPVVASSGATRTLSWMPATS